MSSPADATPPVLLTMTAESLTAARRFHGCGGCEYEAIAVTLVTCVRCGREPTAHVIDKLCSEIDALSAALAEANEAIAWREQLHAEQADVVTHATERTKAAEAALAEAKQEIATLNGQVSS